MYDASSQPFSINQPVVIIFGLYDRDYWTDESVSDSTGDKTLIKLMINHLLLYQTASHVFYLI